MLRRFLIPLAAAALLAVAGCSSFGLSNQPDPTVAAIENLATSCNGVAATVNVLADLRKAGKISATQNDIILKSEPVMVELCSPSRPPVDIPSAIAKIGVIAVQFSGILTANAAK